MAWETDIAPKTMSHINKQHLSLSNNKKDSK